MKKIYWTNCVQWPFSTRKLDEIIEEANEISAETFKRNVHLSSRELQNIKKYPNDFKFYSYKKGKIYFYRHSAIEHFFK